MPMFIILSDSTQPNFIVILVQRKNGRGAFQNVLIFLASITVESIHFSYQFLWLGKFPFCKVTVPYILVYDQDP